MKKLLIIVFAFASTYSFADSGIGESLPNYSITKSEKLNTLKSTEAIFEFSFNIWSATYHPNIKMSHNSINKAAVYNECGKYLLHVKPGKYVFKFFANSQYFEITSDSIAIKPGFVTEININFQSSTVMQVSKKPVIYVYPKESTEVKITLDLKGKFLFTYPEYKDGWNFTAEPNGTISMNEKKYEYLFWDGELNMDLNKINWNEGFVVKKADQVKFFEDKLSQMGLNAREIQDYITFWCPLMAANEQNFIHFVFNDQYNEYASLNITPKPDKVFRVYMMWSKITNMEAAISPFPQLLPSFTRSGFTVVEWGGTEMNSVPRLVEVGQD